MIKLDQDKSPYMTLTCTCKKINPHIVNLRPSLDPKIFTGHCPHWWEVAS